MDDTIIFNDNTGNGAIFRARDFRGASLVTESKNKATIQIVVQVAHDSFATNTLEYDDADEAARKFNNLFVAVKEKMEP